jgi:DNA-directed RNA polymerase subunit omega
MQSFVANEVKMNRTEIDTLADKFGGRYKLTVLIQKRLRELTKGAQKLVDIDSRNLIHVVIEEIKQGKIGIQGYLEADDEKKGKKEKKEE